MVGYYCAGIKGFNNFDAIAGYLEKAGAIPKTEFHGLATKWREYIHQAKRFRLTVEDLGINFVADEDSGVLRNLVNDIATKTGQAFNRVEEGSDGKLQEASGGTEPGNQGA